MLVIGLDAATWRMINPNLDDLPNLKRLMDEGEHGTITLTEKPHSASVWCSVFSGKSQKEHGHDNFIVDGNLRRREDIKVEFIWDVLDDTVDIKALDIPFVYPPYNYNCEYNALDYGLSSDPEVLEKDMELLTEKAIEILKGKPDVFLVVYTMLDKISHFHWGEPILLEWYKKMDKTVGELLQFVDDGDSIIVLSDHGFAYWDEVERHTLTRETPEGEIKGDHHKEAILITKNVDYEINQPQDVCHAIANWVETVLKK